MSTASFTEYRTLEGDRWDTVAQKAYGDPTQYQQIIAANPGIAISAQLPAGILLKVPVISTQVQSVQNQSSLPPWKR